jgi:hypothetical protein
VLQRVVLKRVSLLAMFAGVLTPWASSRAQDQPSVADAARAARLNKEKSATSATQPKKVLTEDDMGSGKVGAGTASLGLGNAVAPKSSSGAGGGNATEQAWAGISRAEASLDKLAPLDRATLAKVVLEGNDVDFPNRAAWEQKLYMAKERYVAHSRQLLAEMTQLMQNAQGLKDSQGEPKVSADSPQAQQLMGQAQQLLSDAMTTEAAFKAVMQEGQDLAKQGSPR